MLEPAGLLAPGRDVPDADPGKASLQEAKARRGFQPEPWPVQHFRVHGEYGEEEQDRDLPPV